MKITNPILGGLQGKSGIGFFQSFVPAAVGLAFVIAAILFVFIFIIGAIGWILSGGDKAAVEAARGKISGAIAGFFLLLILFAIISALEFFFGINILTLDIGPLRIQ